MPRNFLLIADLCIVAACFFLSYWVRAQITPIYPLTAYLSLLPAVLIIWGAFLYHYFSDYASFRLSNSTEIVMLVFKAAALSLVAFGGYTYLLKLHYISRSLALMTFLTSALLISLEKVAVLMFLQNIRKRGYNARNMLIVGTGRRAQQLIQLVRRNAVWGYKIIGMIDEDPAMTGKRMVHGLRVMGTLADLPAIVHQNVIDEVVFVVPRSWLGRIEQAMLFCENEGITVNLAVDFFDLKFSNARQMDFDGFPLLSFKTTTDKAWHLLLKRTYDVAMSGAALVMLSPILAAVALAVKFTSEGPIFFKQERCGLHGRKFMLYKFRTMVVDAEARLKELMAANEMSGPVFKLDKDPRITKIGRFLRKYSLDELPQFWNVFVGEMSLVGPRPPIPSEVNQYDPWHRRRLSMKPGITCLWQVSGRNKITDFDEWVRLDLEYIDHWSLWLEMKILFRTIPAVLTASGAK